MLSEEQRQEERADDAERALDEMQTLLDGREWTNDELARVAEILRATGREIREPRE